MSNTTGSTAGVTGPSEQILTGNKRQNSVTNRTINVSMNPLPNSDSMSGIQSKPAYARTATQAHLPVSKQESSQSANSQGSSGSSKLKLL